MPDGESWLLTRGAASSGGPRVVCFPHAGGNPRSFLGWQPDLDGEAEIVAVCYPGRGHRAKEPAPRSIAELADGAAAAISAAISTEADRPVHLFGHSLGALVAFEVARRLRDRPAVRHLIASGCAAPALWPSPSAVRTASLEGRAFAEAVASYGGLPPEIVAEEELYGLVLPNLQADFDLIAGYRYEPAAPLAVDLTLINGREDRHVGDAELAAWSRESRDEPRRRWADGGHFYFDGRPFAVTGLLRSLTGDGAGDQHVELI